MNKKELVSKITGGMKVRGRPVHRKDVDEILSLFMQYTKVAVAKNIPVTLVGFGTFKKLKRASRVGVNPSTSERINIPAKSVPKFVAGKDFIDTVR